MTISYVLDQKLYLNITNQCPNRCDFCIRTTQMCIRDRLGPLLPLNPDFTNLLLKELLGEDFRPLLLPYEDIAYACRVSELLSPLTKKKTKK